MSLMETQDIMAELLFEEDTHSSYLNFVEYLRSTGQNTSHIDEDGWRLTHLILMKLRLERLLNAVPSMKELFDKDSAEFMKIFKTYHSQCPSDTFFPQEEIKKFLDFYHNWYLDTLD